MLSKLKKNNSSGFTIIEVMIVLAIAGLILLIVFLAIPALQRNGRNTQRKNDAANLAGGVATYLSNNNGTLPLSIGNGTAGSVDFCTAGGTAGPGALAAGCGAGNTESARIGYFPQASVYINKSAIPATPVVVTIGAPGTESATQVTTNNILMVFNERCGAAATPGTGTYNAKSVAIFYVTEAATGNGSLQCNS